MTCETEIGLVSTAAATAIKALTRLEKSRQPRGYLADAEDPCSGNGCHFSRGKLIGNGLF